MYILFRELSDYSTGNILLGVFEKLETANLAKHNYSKSITSNDPYSNQPYREIDLEKDVQIIEVPFIQSANENSLKVFVVVGLSEGFGQLTTNFNSVFDNDEAAQIRAGNFEEELIKDWENSWSEIVELTVDTLIEGA